MPHVQLIRLVERLLSRNRIFGVLVLAMLFAAPGLAAKQEESPAPSQPPGVEYDVEITGSPSGEAKRLMESGMQTLAEGERLPASLAQLARRAKDDLPSMGKALESLGYYKATLDSVVEPPAEEGEPATVIFTVTPGPRFTLGRVVINSADEHVDMPEPKYVGLDPGEPFRADDVLQAEQELVRRLRNSGHPFAKADKRRLVADFSSDTMDVELNITPGPSATFGPLSVVTKGKATVAVEFLRREIPIKEGDVYSRRELNDARRKLLGTGLYSQVEFSTPKEVGADGRLPLTLTVTEREHRSFRVGLSYSLDRGPGGLLGWQHRNLLGAGERLDIRAEADFLSKSLTFEYLEPRFLHDRQRLRLTASALDQDLDAFDGRSLRLQGLLEVELSNYATFGYGGAYTFLEVDDDPLRDGKEVYHLISAPAFFELDRRNDILNPTKGYFARADAEPFLGVFGERARFVRYSLGAGTYFRLVGEDTLILAVRGKLGQILGDELQAIPAAERFYAGGGGSVRGYDFKTVSPLDGDDPIGGRSLIETSTELRWRMPNDFGLVAFVDAGRAYDKPFPDFNEPLAVGAGIGGRYYLDFGPVRLDIAVPLNRRKDIDPPIQVYASIGQSF